MKTKELLLECKVKLGIQTDYKLAKELKIPRARICDYMAGRRKPDAYGTTRIALCLGRDPATVTAEIELESETNPEKKEFWRDFLARASMGKGYMLALTCGSILLAASIASDDSAAQRPVSHNDRLRKTKKRKPETLLTNRPMGGFFWKRSRAFDSLRIGSISRPS